MTHYISVTDFAKTQHYKHRNPPWIRMYNSLLGDYAFSKLPDLAKLDYMLLCLLASQLDNKIPADLQWIKSRLDICHEPHVILLIERGFLDGDSAMLASCKQSAPTETEQSRVEKETISFRDIKEKAETALPDEPAPPSVNGVKFDDDPKPERKRAAPRGTRIPWPEDQDEPPPGFYTLANESGLGTRGDVASIRLIDHEWLKFRDWAHSAPGSKGVKISWPATWRNWCREVRKRMDEAEARKQRFNGRA